MEAKLPYELAPAVTGAARPACMYRENCSGMTFRFVMFVSETQPFTVAEEIAADKTERLERDLSAVIRARAGDDKRRR